MARDAYPYLQQLDQEHKKGCENYLYANYDHYVYFPSFTETNVLKMARNTLIEGLNRRVKLPNTVIVLLGEQIITEDPLFLPSEFERKFKWLLREWDVNIRLRKSSLPPKAYTMGQPRIMWVQGFRTRRGSKVDQDNLLKYNNLLRRTCMAKAVYTIPVNDSSFRCFDFDGRTQLPEGFKFLWQEIVNGLQSHDEKDKQYEINRLVDKRLKEMDLQAQSQQEGCAHTLNSLRQNQVPNSNRFGDNQTRDARGNWTYLASGRSRSLTRHATKFNWDQSLAYQNSHNRHHYEGTTNSFRKRGQDKRQDRSMDRNRKRSSSPPLSVHYNR